VDEREVDTLGRRKTTIVAIDALHSPGMRQYRENFLLRSVNIGYVATAFMDAKPQLFMDYENIILNSLCLMFRL